MFQTKGLVVRIVACVHRSVTAESLSVMVNVRPVRRCNTSIVVCSKLLDVELYMKCELLHTSRWCYATVHAGFVLGQIIIGLITRRDIAIRRTSTEL